MNERIRQLAEQAEFFERDLLIQGDNFQRFAELIVRECIDYCGENLSKTVGGALKIHFGVES
jgi:predicted lipid carrier protein YhbT